ncbi:23S rRNA (uracil(1939)-C(5))-methyltransferase RlmD [Methylophaga pinxianii]|uniref:23S rRNA (uracil(1939)-C(5))-methyltransferase RlmD n=1 Tax=Methylophaga pinxianii TaxID=2881052 RepID=UPI001CF2D7EA|nr:23S rRNA (uracil(1939)-C(5))-methyltransferase RlmD [Methylophaga pinxianii]MCB2426148.1 23S rRNA (uracil(1939)-C(5))-methyltransferase RlmD [Methylophaga pinxianii]UPH45140.1 23S rRNA (uracil(1939)-C(5))-methyltransferase RlmD [Methylophaga pinxianii]
MARRNQRQRLPTEAVQAVIESLSHDGRGIARIEGKTVFVDGALAGENVSFLYTRLHKKYDEAKVVSVENASADRVEAKCRHFGICGGCSLMHMSPEAQLSLKQDTLKEQLSHFGQLTPEQWLPPLTGPLWGYRRKARLGVRYVTKKEKVLVGFREKGSPYLAELTQCEVLDPRVGLRLEELGKMIAELEAYNRIAQIEVAMDDANTALVFRNMDPLCETDKQKLIHYGQQNDLWIYQQPGGPDTVTPLWPEDPQLHYAPEEGLRLEFAPGDFTQVNAGINHKMITKAIELLDLQESDRVLDLFCGLGNFTLPLAKRVNSVIGVEGDKSLVAHAQRNAAINDLTNAEFELADLTVTQLKDYPWAQAGFTKVLLDPPRSGAFEVLGQIADLGAETIVYVSCNPATLARDAGELVNEYGYTLVQTGIMDMFPHTSHVESIALFKK